MKSKAKRDLTTTLTSDRSVSNQDKAMLLAGQDSQHSLPVGSVHASWPMPVQPIAVHSLIAAESSMAKSLMHKQLIYMIENYMAEVERE
ncbi:hypothetical protein [Herminiimonas contaminans]|uniref:Uncharacterized protein n=1 Tax=Herminiimonas contaminans TaxID=1111140 RepID=A0ABS0EV13_9BURK|nr:hypothetical protein [Herminiimonas contaminans]MBF8178368.1 hypothetical protein [Herminiimonas contaminans]